MSRIFLVHNPIRKQITPQHAKEMLEINYEDVKKDILELLTNSQPSWPADYGNYGPMFIRLAWHASGSYRTSDGRGGSDGGRQRFDPERSWMDNTNLDKARNLLVHIKEKYGRGLSWGDLIVLSGDTAIESMGGPILGFCGGRIDDIDGSESNLLGPTAEQEILYPCSKEGGSAENGECETPLGSTTIGLIYVNPEGPLANPVPSESVHQVRDTFDRMNMNDSETIALIGGGHAVGKTHGACPTGPGDSPKDNPEHPWEGTCGQGEMKGKGINTFTSGFEFPWTTTPTQWSNQFFKNLLKFDWIKVEKEDTPGGHYEWKVNETIDTSPVAPKADGSGTQKIGMLTTDRSLLEDENYRKLLELYAADLDAFNNAFKNAWYKLTTRDMGPRSRCIENEMLPPPQDWQYPLPESDENLDNFDKIRDEIKTLLTPENKGMFTRLAWRCMSTFRSTDYLGGCNGARVRFEPQKEWEVNTGISDILSKLQSIKNAHGEALSWADLIVVAGNTEIEAMGGKTMQFCGGRTDATDDAGASEFLEPKITGKFDETDLQLKEFYSLMGLTPHEYAALHGAGYAVGQEADCKGLFCRRDNTTISELSNVFFRNIIENSWTRNEDSQTFIPDDNSDLRMYSADVQFYFDPELKVLNQIILYLIDT